MRIQVCRWSTWSTQTVNSRKQLENNQTTSIVDRGKCWHSFIVVDGRQSGMRQKQTNTCHAPGSHDPATWEVEGVRPPVPRRLSTQEISFKTESQTTFLR